MIACRGHLPGAALSSRWAVAAVVDPDPSARRAAALVAGDAGILASGVCLADDVASLPWDLDLVTCAVPPDLQGGVLAEALKRCRTVLCEKPLMSQPSSIPSGGQLVVVHNALHEPLVRVTLGSVALGSVGMPHEVRYDHHLPRAPESGSWRLAIGPGLDLGYHGLYVCEAATGSPIGAIITSGSRDDVSEMRLRHRTARLAT